MINKDMTLVEILDLNIETAKVFSGYGMGCVGCIYRHRETLEQACQTHNIDLDEILAKLNAVVEAK